MNNEDTIAAIATAHGAGGVGIIRISGKKALEICQKLTSKTPQARYASFAKFVYKEQQIDEGLCLYFPAPNSFTGDDVIELQAHGGVVVLNMLLSAVLECGARMAEPGEFSQRAFLNGKIDLVQAEAIADLISSTTEKAAKAAQQSLQGQFSEKIQTILIDIIELRVWIEAAIDFPEEEIDFLADKKQQEKLISLKTKVSKLLAQAQQGEILNKGIMVGIVGQPNVGKSSILNLFTKNDTAIVSDIAGTTRDVIKESINIEGVPVTIIDTAGIHFTEDKIEQEGIKRAKKILEQADVLLQVVDASKNIEEQTQQFDDLVFTGKKIIVLNKTDLSETNKTLSNAVLLSAKTGNGFETLEKRVLELMGHEQSNESVFSARQRHIHHLQNTEESLATAEINFIQNHAGELVAEDLRIAQENLSYITGEFSSDDLLGEIFSSFCIGK